MAEEDYRAFRVILLSVVLASSCTVALTLRLAARWKSDAKLGWDDGFIIISLFCYYSMVCCSNLTVEIGGLGKPLANLHPAKAVSFLQLMMASMVAYALTITTTKLSLLLFLGRIFEPKFRLWFVILEAVCLIWLMIAVLTDVLQCSPINAAFKLRLLFTERCLNFKALYWGITISNLVLDIIILVLPMWMIIDLKLPLQKKCLLCGVFGLGGMGCVAGLMRVVAIGDIQRDDLTRSMVMEYIWSQVEPATAIIGVCASTYRPLLVNWSLRSTSSRPIPRLQESSRSPVTWPTARDADRPATRDHRYTYRQADTMFV